MEDINGRLIYDGDRIRLIKPVGGHDTGIVRYDVESAAFRIFPEQGGYALCGLADVPVEVVKGEIENE